MSWFCFSSIFEFAKRTRFQTDPHLGPVYRYGESTYRNDSFIHLFSFHFILIFFFFFLTLQNYNIIQRYRRWPCARDTFYFGNESTYRRNDFSTKTTLQKRDLYDRTTYCPTPSVTIDVSWWVPKLRDRFDPKRSARRHVRFDRSGWLGLGR